MVSGQIDRLVVTPSEVLIVDYKTNHAPPATAAEAPQGYIRQLGLYRAALAETGKPFPAELPMRRELYVAPTREAAWRECGPYLEGKYKTYSAWGQDKVVPEAAGILPRT